MQGSYFDSPLAAKIMNSVTATSSFLGGVFLCVLNFNLDHRT